MTEFILDVDPCRQMWFAVLKRAQDDSDWLYAYRGRSDMTTHERKRYERSIEDDPDEFLAGDRCKEICELLGFNMRPRVRAC